MQTAVIQACMGSSRLPEKVLREVGGKPLLQYRIERLRRARHLQQPVDATSDDPLAALGRTRKTANT
jgi:spore coat polysaccharide biosynthesis protein SpsF